MKMRASVLLTAGVAVFAATTAVALRAQRTDVFVGDRDAAAISYTNGPTRTGADQANERIRQGTLELKFESDNGYLRSVLDALDVPIESQVTVFSQGSFQGSLINPSNPRAIFFNDTVAIGWTRGADSLEVAAQDPQKGVIFYTVDQTRGGTKAFARDQGACLECHLTWDTLGVPGLMVLTTFPMQKDGDYANGFVSDHRSPVPERWGGWFVTGKPAPVRHMGNLPTNPSDRKRPAPRVSGGILASLEGKFDPRGFPSHYSDVIALMVLEHQTRGINYITRAGWEARLAGRMTPRVQEAVGDLVDYLLFVDEAPFPSRVEGSSGFAEKFVAAGPRDSKGRSLRQLDLQRRLLRYPCSYLVYSEAFDALPEFARDAAYKAMWNILSGTAPTPRYAKLSLADRKAVVDILRDTKKNLPAYFQSVSR